MLTRAEFTELATAAEQDPRPLIEGAFDIETKRLPGQKVIDRLVFNPAQVRVHERLMAMRRAGRPPRGIVLKARQPGISTQASGYVLATALTRPFTRSMQIAQDEDASIGIFQKIDLMLERLPPELRPALDIDRRDAIMLSSLACLDSEVQLHSHIHVAWAGGRESWRSKTLQTAHLSEFAIMPNAADVLLGVLQSVPLTPESLVIVESTARGVGNAFHEEWERAEAGKSDFEAIFIPWFDLPENRMLPPADFEADPEERDMAKAYALDAAQLQWRRYKLHTECRGDLDKFNQEHPPSAAEAFVISGRPVFNVAMLRKLRERANLIPAPEVGTYTLEHGFQVHRYGNLAVFHRPIASHEYTIGADPSSGERNGDAACAQVFDRTTEEQVAVWHGHVNPVVFARITNALGRWYNNAYLAPELNGGWGNSMVEELKALQYPSLYVWSRPDKVKGGFTNFLGWMTSFRTKQHMIDTCAHALNEGSVGIYDLETLHQFEKFQYFDDVRAAGSNYADDACMAFLIAYRVHIEYPMAATGIPPRVHFEEPGAAEAEPVPVPQTPMNVEAWKDADEQMGKLRRGSRIQDELVQPDDQDIPADERGGLIVDHPW